MCGSGCNSSPAPASAAPGAAQAPITEITSGCSQQTQRLRLRITAFFWDTTIAVSRNQNIVPSPHWAVGRSINDAAYSRRPGAYLK
jgi:hypothetical protein